MSKEIIVVIAYEDTNPESPTYKNKIVSHGENLNTGQTIIFPPELLNSFPCHYDPELCEYILD